MAKMWAGRTDGATEKLADDFNSSIHFDSRMYKQDITGSMAHAQMLSHKGIISGEEAQQLVEGLAGILEDLENGKADGKKVYLKFDDEGDVSELSDTK